MIIIRLIIREFEIADLKALKDAIELATDEWEGVEIDISLPPDRPFG